MSNEVIFIITFLIVFGFIRYSFFQGRRWLHASIVINLLLISVFGAKLVSVFGFTTNIGNIFYAAVFFAGQLLVEHFGREEGKRSIWLGFWSVAFFVLMGQLTLHYVPIPEAQQVSDAIATLFSFVPRVAFASLFAYLFAQSVNILLYGYLRMDRRSKIWKRSLLSSAAGQAVDSIVFFTIAFYGTVSTEVFWQTLLVGFAVKFALGALSVPFMYSSYSVKTRREILEQEAEAIIHGIGDGVVMTDREGKIILVNKSFEELLGYKSKEVMGKQMTEVLKRLDEEGHPVLFKERILTQVLAGKKMVTPMTNHTYFVRKDGTKFPVRIVVTPVLIDNTILGAVEVFQDVTREKELDKLRTDFLSLASHELRTPLSGTRWTLETLKKGIFGKLNAKQEEYIDNLSQINSRMIQLSSDILNVLHVEGGVLKVNKDRFTVEDVLKEVVFVMQFSAKEKDLKLAMVTHHESIFVESDFKLVKNIIEAFVSNAINYSASGGEIVLDAKEQEGDVIFSVKDRGIGIPKSEQQQIFEKFYRASNAKSLKPDGTGLGLYIAQVCAQKLGAKITFDSTERKGSTFCLAIRKSI